MIAWRLPTALVFLSLTGLLAGAVTAAPISSAKVVVGGTLIHVVHTSWAGHSPQQRADQVQQRLTAVLAQGPIYPKDITVGMVQDDWCVLFRGRRLLTADPMTAKQQHSNPQALVRQWAAHLRQVLPDLTKSKSKSK